MPKTTQNHPGILLCDPDPAHRASLQNLIDQIIPMNFQPEMALCFEEVVHKIVEIHPRLVVIDVSQQDDAVFSLLEKLPDRDFQLLFTTSHETFPSKVFTYNAVGYLFKPIQTIPLTRAMETFNTREQIKLLSDKAKDQGLHQKIVLRTMYEFILIDLTDIIRLESDGSYTTFHQTDGTKSIIARHLKEFENMLPPDHFFRIHASHIIRLHFVKKFIKEAGMAVMCDGSMVPVSRRKKDDFIKKFMTLSIG